MHAHLLCLSGVDSNVALGRPTFESAVKGGRGGSLAVDGNRSPDAENVGSCTVMEASPRAWWIVDLGAVFNVKEVAISQRDKHGKIREGLCYVSSHATVVSSTRRIPYYLTICVS